MPTLVVMWLLTFIVHWVHVKRVVLPNSGACQGRQTWRFKNYGDNRGPFWLGPRVWKHMRVIPMDYFWRSQWWNRDFKNVVEAIISHGIIRTSTNFSLLAQYCRILSSLSMISNCISMYISNVSKAFNLSNVGVKNVFIKLRM